MMVASLLAAHSINCSRRCGLSTTPVGHWCAGVSTTALAPVAASAVTLSPDSSTGTGTASTPAVAAAAATVALYPGSSNPTRVTPALASVAMTRFSPWAKPVQMTIRSAVTAAARTRRR